MVKRAIILFVVLGVFLGARDWLPEDNVHRQADSLIRAHWQKDKSALKRMARECESDEKHSFFLCLLAAKNYYKKDKSKSRRLLNEAIKAEPLFAEAVNSYKSLFGREVPPLKDPKWLNYEKALRAAEQKNNDAAIKHLRVALAAGLPAIVVRNQPLLKKYARNKELMSRATVQKGLADVHRAGGYRLALSRLVDVYYTYRVHTQRPDQSKVMYHYYRAYSNARAGRRSRATANLKIFIKNLEQARLKDNKPATAKVVAHALIYLKQSKTFARLQRYAPYRQWFVVWAKKYKIPGYV